MRQRLREKRYEHPDSDDWFHRDSDFVELSAFSGHKTDFFFSIVRKLLVFDTFIKTTDYLQINEINEKIKSRSRKVL